jgi:hypothetical protein
MTMAKGTPKWTPERDEELRRMWDVEGLSSGDIAYVMDTTRNAVISRANRLHLSKRDSKKTAPRLKPRKPRKHRDITTYFRRHQKQLPLLSVPLPGDTRAMRGDAWAPLPGSLPVSLIGLERGMCRWPVTESTPHLFCGLACDGPYCIHHHELSVGRGTPSERNATEWKEAA